MLLALFALFALSSQPAPAARPRRAARRATRERSQWPRDEGALRQQLTAAAAAFGASGPDALRAIEENAAMRPRMVQEARARGWHALADYIEDLTAGRREPLRWAA